MWELLSRQTLTCLFLVRGRVAEAFTVVPRSQASLALVVCVMMGKSFASEQYGLP